MFGEPHGEAVKKRRTGEGGIKKARKTGPRKLGKLATLKKELRTTRTKAKLNAQRAETELAQLERRKSRKLVFVER